MASRKEEKERLRQERIAREEAERRKQQRSKRLQLVFGGLLAALAVAGAVIAVVLLVGGGDDGGGGDRDAGQAKGADDVANVSIPAQKTADLDEAVKTAGCELKTGLPIEGREHAQREFTARDYKSNPPTSGNHFPEWYEDGIYAPGDTPQLGQIVHTLEHGRIDIQYKPGTPQRTVQQLESLYAEEPYHKLLFQNETNMPYAVAASAWGQLVGCPEMNDGVFDVLRSFSARYIDQGPEKVP